MGNAQGGSLCGGAAETQKEPAVTQNQEEEVRTLDMQNDALTTGQLSLMATRGTTPGIAARPDRATAAQAASGGPIEVSDEARMGQAEEEVAVEAVAVEASAADVELLVEDEPEQMQDSGAKDETEEPLGSILKHGLYDAWRDCKDLLSGRRGAEDIELPREGYSEDFPEEGFVPMNHKHLQLLYQKMPVIMRASACTKVTSSGTPEWRSIKNTTRAELGEYGVGIQLYFELLLAMGVLFLMLFLINLPSLVLCVMGSGIAENPATKDAGVMSYFSWFTIANLGSCEGSTLCHIDPDAKRMISKGSSTYLKHVTWIIGALDGLSCVIFLLFGVIFSHWWIPKQVQRHDEEHVTAADFAIEVNGLPWCIGGSRQSELHKSYEEELKAHFTKLLAKCPDFDPEPVHEVALIRDYGGHVRSFMNIGTMQKILSNEKARLRIAQHHGLAKKIKPLQDKIAKLAKEIQESDDQMGDQGDMLDIERGICSAFVMFKTEPLKDYALMLYSPYQDWLSLMNQPKKLQFHHRKLWVNQACEPRDLYWENLDYGRWRRVARQTIMFVAAVAFIIFCTMLLINLRSYKVQGMNRPMERAATYVLRPAPAVDAATGQETDGGCVKICNWQLYTDTVCTMPSAAPDIKIGQAGGVKTLTSKALAGQTLASCDNIAQTYGSGVTDQCVAWIAYTLDEVPSPKCTQITQMEPAASEKALALYACKTWNASNPDWTQCIRMQNPLSEDYPEFGLGQPQKGLVSADQFCSLNVDPDAAQVSRDKAIANGIEPQLDPQVNCYCTRMGLAGAALDPICTEWATRYSLKFVIMAISVTAVCVINVLLDTLFYYMDDWTRHGTMTKLTMSSMNKLFFALFVNTGLIFLLVSANFHGSFTLDNLAFLGLGKVGKGPFSDVTPSWFVVSGTDFFLTIACNLLCFTLTPLAFSFFVNPFFIRLFRRGLVTENALRDVYVLPEWPLSLRLAQTVTTFFCVMMFCGGMPLLYLVGAAYCGLSYWTDKAALLRGSMMPPTYHADMIVQTLRWVSTAGFLHCCMTCWMYGLQEIFPSDWSSSRGLFEFLLNISTEEYDDAMKGWRAHDEPGYDNPYFTAYLDARMLDIGHQGGIVVAYMLMCYLLYFLLHHFLWALVVRPLMAPVIYWVNQKMRTMFPKAEAVRSKTLEGGVDKTGSMRHSASNLSMSPQAAQAGPASSPARSPSNSRAESKDELDEEARQYQAMSRTNSLSIPTAESITDVLGGEGSSGPFGGTALFSYKMENNPRYEQAYKALKFCETND